MAVNKVEITTKHGTETVIDISKDSVTSEMLEEGITAHGANGEQIVGTGLPGRVRYDKEQVLTAEEKDRARCNIDSPCVDDLENIKPTTEVDATLTKPGVPADSKCVGEKLDQMAKAIANLGTGGGSGNNILSVTNTTGWTSVTISKGEECSVSFNWTSIEGDVPTGSGYVNIQVNGVSKGLKGIEQGDVSLDIKDMLDVETNIVRLVISDAYGNSKPLMFSVTVVSFSLASTFNDGIPYTGAITFPYTPNGNVPKTMHFKLNGTEIGTAVVETSGRQQSFTIPMQPHGAYSFEVYFTATVNEDPVESNHLYYDIMFLEEGNNAPIVASPFSEKELSQYYTASIPYTVYTPNALTSEVVLYANDVEVNRLTVGRTKQIWNYRADAAGALKLEIASGDVRKVFNITVAASNIDVSAETNNLELFLTSYGRSNTEGNPGVWTYGDVEAELQNFNWASDGWQLDKDNNTVLRVAGDARVYIPLNIFGTDFRTSGKTIEFEFTPKDVMNYDATIISCLADGKGIVFTPQKATLMSEQSTVFAQYKEDEPIRVAFVVDKKAESRLINVYIDGILSGTVQYPETDDFQQGNPVGITIGSKECTVDLYCIRVYGNNLTRHQMLDNWIADTPNGAAMLDRYSKNNIYNAYGEVVISKLPRDLPYIVFEAAELPQYKGDKKAVTGYYVDPNNPSKSFRFEGAEIDVQGTSSQYYKRKNYKVKFKKGFIMESSKETLNSYQLRDDSISVSTFTFKADVASCEGANNVELVRLWNDICPFKTVPQLENSYVRQGIDGFPIVAFWNDGTNVQFLGKYNFNNDKGTAEVFGFREGDESWEIRNNTSARSMFKSADFSGTAWLEDFEGRYPDGNTDPAALQRLAEWLVSTDQEQATGNPITSVTYDGVTYTSDTAAYRLAKFKAEADDWLEMDSIIFSYIFTELFLLVDSRAKNNFPTFYVGGKWCVLPYDMDTAIGTNNEGLLVFDYNLEDIDTVGGSNVYNGQDSVLYINTRDAFGDRIEEMYKTLRSGSVLTYEKVEKRFEDHQALWPEAIFNEDAYYKYIDPLIEDGEATYLSMCQGSKESQRKWWLFNRFRYIDSKYTTGDALTSTITLRAYQKSNFQITPYADVYPCVAFDSTRVKARGKRNEVCAINSPDFWDPNGSDAVVTVYSAEQLRDIGDISPFKVGYADFSKATKLQRIKAGDASPTYSNPNMTELYVGNNKLLQILDVRNCPNLKATVNLSACSGLEEAYFDGTSITGIQLPNGGSLRKLHLPETITNLEVLNQSSLTEVEIAGYDKLTTLRVENSPLVPTDEIISKIPTGSRVRLIGVNWNFANGDQLLKVHEKLATMRGLDEYGNNTNSVIITGKCYIELVADNEFETLQGYFPNVTFTYGRKSTKAYLFFMNDDGTQELHRQVIYDGGSGYDPVVAGEVARPTKAETAQYRYSYQGWSSTKGGPVESDLFNSVLTDRYVYAAFSFITKKYVIHFYNGSKLLQYGELEYGVKPEYTGDDPVPPNADDSWSGWIPSIAPVTGNVSYMAKFTPHYYTRDLLWRRALTEFPAEFMEGITKVKPYAFAYSNVSKVSLPNATVIGERAFTNNRVATEIVAPNAETIGTHALAYCISLVKVKMPKLLSAGEYLLASSTKVAEIDVSSFGRLSNAQLIGYCYALKTLIMRADFITECTMSNAIYSNCPIAQGTGYIYVPKALVESYKVATNWTKYANQFRALEDYTVDGTTTGELDASKI